MEERDLAEIIGNNIMRLRKMANMTQQGLAERINYSDKSVSKWEQGNGVPDVRILVKLAEVFNVSVDDLVHEHAEKPVMPRRTRLLRRFIIVALSVGMCWLAAVVSFVLGRVIDPEVKLLWLAFVYAVAASAIVVLVFSCVWSWKWARIVSVSVLIWTALACVCLTVYLCLPTPHPTVWLLFLIGVPLQLLALIAFVWWKRIPFFK